MRDTFIGGFLFFGGRRKDGRGAKLAYHITVLFQACMLCGQPINGVIVQKRTTNSNDMCKKERVTAKKREKKN